MSVKKNALILTCLLFAGSVLRSQVIVTFAGQSTAGNTGNGGPAVSAKLNTPQGMCFDASGNLYIADSGNHSIRKVDQNGTITTFAGTGVAGFSGDGGPASAAKLNNPSDLAIDAAGNIYVCDELNERIRKIDVSGNISTIAGTGTAGYSGDGGAATSATMDHPFRIALDASGNLFIADAYNYVVRKVNTSGIMSTVAGNNTAGFSGDGGQATSASINEASGLAFDGNGNMYIADEYNHRVRMVNTSGVIITVAGSGAYGYSGDGGPATSAAFPNLIGLAVDAAGNIYIPDRLVGVVRKVDHSTGIINTIAGNGTAGYSGDGGAPLLAQMNMPCEMSFDAGGYLYIADCVNHNIRKICVAANLAISGVTSLCTGGNGTILTASGASTYTWSANAGSVNTSTVSLNPAVGNTTYTVSTYDNACPIKKTVTVTVSTTPTLSVGGNTNVCSGNNTVLTGSGATSYTWNTGFVSVSSSTISVTPSSSTTFTLTGANGNCTDTKTVSINVTQTPTLSISGSTNICSGNGTILTGSGATTYTWSSNAGGVNTSTVGLSPNSTTTYTLSGANGNCAVFTTATVSVTPTPTINVSGNLNICSGASASLFGGTATTYTWSSNAGGVNTSTVSVSPNVTTTYTLSGSNGSCTSSQEVTVNVTTTPTVDLSGNTSVCQGNGTSLTGTGASTYTWVTSSNGNTTTTTSTNSVTTISILPSSNVTYTLTGANGACPSTPVVVTVTVNPLPVVTLDSLGFPDSLCYDAGAQALTGGSPAGGVYSGAGVSNGNFYPVVGPGTFNITYTYTDANGCSAEATHSVTVTTCGLDINAYNSDKFKMYPNPSNGELHITVGSNFVEGDLEVIDVTGRIVLSQKITTADTPLDLETINSGVYFVQVSHNGVLLRQKLVRQ